MSEARPGRRRPLGRRPRRARRRPASRRRRPLLRHRDRRLLRQDHPHRPRPARRHRLLRHHRAGPAAAGLRGALHRHRVRRPRARPGRDRAAARHPDRGRLRARRRPGRPAAPVAAGLPAQRARRRLHAARRRARQVRGLRDRPGTPRPARPAQGPRPRHRRLGRVGRRRELADRPMTTPSPSSSPTSPTVAAATQTARSSAALILVVGSLLGLGLALMLAVGLARRITRPLRRLTVAAGEIGDELPQMVERMQTPGDGPGVVVEPIPVESARRDRPAGRGVQHRQRRHRRRSPRSRPRCASSIAEMFVNVARRNQVLLGRQLSQLDTMEAREEDPDVLDSLFKLDHLATRMRRNAESLLVLAGIDSDPPPAPRAPAVRRDPHRGRRDRGVRPDRPVDVGGPRRLRPARADRRPPARRAARERHPLLQPGHPGRRVAPRSPATASTSPSPTTAWACPTDEIADANEKIAHPPVAEIAVSQRLGPVRGRPARLPARRDRRAAPRPGRRHRGRRRACPPRCSRACRSEPVEDDEDVVAARSARGGRGRRGVEVAGRRRHAEAGRSRPSRSRPTSCDEPSTRSRRPARAC